ncbi:dopamine beta-hydroxylase-like [Haliotis asinina]|uniref:dopamine beta-hydroxylase-like n=1 Tax=Haliotis asinina TaxID=109174 RepID=UPI00353214FC
MGAEYLLLLMLPSYHISAHIGDFSPAYDYSVTLDARHHMHLHWSVDYTNHTVLMKIVTRTTNMAGFGIGFSNYGAIANADLAVFWTDVTGTHHFQDAWSGNDGILHLDQSQDAVLTHARSTKDLTVLHYYRKIITCDDDDYQLDNGTTHLVYFLIEDDQRTPNAGSVYGINISTTNHGFQRVQLLKPDIPGVKFPPDTWTFSILAPEVHVPANETTYWWHTTRLPQLQHKHHIIQYEGVIDRGNEDVVHHIEVFHCVGVEDNMPFYSGPGEGENKPPTLSKCRNVIGAWAMGAGPIVYPEEAGSPVGGIDSTPYVLLEIHYNNPEHIQGIVDSSGIRFYVTRQLRQYDSGIMELGLEYTDKMALPPGLPSVSLTGFCVQTCTQVGIPSGGIHIFASQLHTHLTGKKVYTRHVRDDRELPELNRDNHYSPHFQEIRRLPVPINILPGDALVTTCEYNTVSRANVTVGGLAITDEMCVNYVHYYPRGDLEVCKSSIDTSALLSFFKFMNKMELQPTSPLKTSRANYHGIDWSPLNVHLLEYLYDTSSLSVQCNKSDGQRFCGTWNGVPPTSTFGGLMHHGSICKGSHSSPLL